MLQECFKGLYNLRPLEALTIIVVSGVLIFANGYVNMRSGYYGIIPLFWLNAVLAIIGIWNLCRIVDGSVKKNCRRIYSLILNIGRDSIVYLCLNQFFIKLVRMGLGGGGSFSGSVFDFALLVVVLILIEVARNLILSTPVKFIVGK